MAWFKVISHTPIVINHGNGAVHSLPRGTVFEAGDDNPDVVKYLTRFKPPKIVTSAPASDGVKAPAASYPIPGPAKPAPKKQLPAGISEIVKGPALRGQN